MPRELLSIVMPAYNAEAYIAEAIKSLQAQTYPHWELIVADDNSTDHTRDVVVSFAASDPRIRLLRRTANSGGAFVPRSEAAGIAKGDYIVELDADDYMDSDYLESISARIKATGADIVFGNMTFVYADGTSSPLTTRFDRQDVVDGASHLHLTLDQWGDGCKGALRRAIFLTATRDPIVNGTSMSADELLTRVIMLQAAKIAFVEPTYYYRIHTGSTTRAMHPRLFDVLDTDMRLRRLIESHYPSGSQEIRLINNQATANLWSCLRNYASFKFRDKQERKRIRHMLTEAYGRRHILKSRRRIGTLRTAILLCGPATTIIIQKLLSSLGKRQ